MSTPREDDVLFCFGVREQERRSFGGSDTFTTLGRTYSGSHLTDDSGARAQMRKLMGEANDESGEAFNQLVAGELAKNRKLIVDKKVVNVSLRLASYQ